MNMHHQPSKRRKHMTGIELVLVMLTVLICVSVIITTLFKLAQTQSVSASPGEKSASSPVVRRAFATPITTLTSLTPSSSPNRPVQPLGYPLYHGNLHQPEIALTFDDGPNPSYTAQVLAVLQRYAVKATFFVVGYLVADYPKLVQQEYQQGDAVGNHSWTHPELIKLSPAAIRNQLKMTSNEIQTVTGVAPTVFRPPYGEINSAVRASAASLGLATILWNVDPKDWSLPGTNAIISRVLFSAHNGAIILLHDGGGNRFQTVAALSAIITGLEQRGFRFVTIPQLMRDLSLVA